MPSVRHLSVLAAALPLLAGCGGSSHPAASTGAATAATSSASTSLTATTASASTRSSASTSASVSSHSGGSTAQSGGSTAPGSGGAGLAPGSAPASGGAAAGGSINARVPATFTLAAAGTLSPGQVSAPAFLAVAVRINSASSSAHTATIATPHPVHLQIPPHGVGATTIPGLRAGTYAILIDGARRGALVIGGEPGP